MALAIERTWYAIQLADAGQYSSVPDLAVPAADFLRDHQVEREEMLARAVAACALAQLGRRAGAADQLARAHALLDRPRPVDSRAKTAILLIRAALQLGDRSAARAILAAIPRDRVGVPWAAELAGQAHRLGVP